MLMHLNVKAIRFAIMAIFLMSMPQNCSYLFIYHNLWFIYQLSVQGAMAVCIISDSYCIISSPLTSVRCEIYGYFSLQESTRINHSTVRCAMSAWTNVLKENTSADLILGTMNAVSA